MKAVRQACTISASWQLLKLESTNDIGYQDVTEQKMKKKGNFQIIHLRISFYQLDRVEIGRKLGKET